MNTGCNGCLWFDQCGCSSPCEDYSPAADDFDQIIEDNRVKFHEEWNEYVSEFEG